MIPPTSIDGTDITGATIDGTDVQEITVDGNTVFSAVDVPNDTIGYWPGDEGSGTTLHDRVGSADLTINGPTWITDSDFQVGKGLDFGSSRGNDFEITGTTLTPSEFSWFLRVNVDELTAGSPTIRGILGYDEDPQVRAFEDFDVLQFRLERDGFSIEIDNISSVTGNVIIVARCDSTETNLDLFDNSGSLLDSVTGAGKTPVYESSTAIFGNILGSRDFQGNMDPNWIQIDGRVSDPTMNSIISQYY